VIAHAKQSSNLVPPYLDVAEAQKDYKLAADSREIYLEQSKFLRSIEDSMMVTSSEPMKLHLFCTTQLKAHTDLMLQVHQTFLKT
jgi:hypothetical protein